jgi:hypothetical protein
MGTDVIERQRYSEVRVHEMAGQPPDGSPDWKTFASNIPVYNSIDLDMLHEGDDDPFYVTLDIFKVNVTSANGMVYDEAFIKELLDQVPGLGAKDGHTPWTDMGSFSDEADWVGHVWVGDTVYAKAYIPPGDVRNQMRRNMARKGKVRTSIEVWGIPVPILDGDGKDTGTFRVSDPELDAVDFVRASAAALGKHQSGSPIHSSETIRESETELLMATTITLADVPADIKRQILEAARIEHDIQRVAEIKQQLETATAQLTTEREAKAALETQVAERDTRIQTMETQLTDVNSRITAFEAREFEAALETEISKLTNWNITTEAGKAKVKSLRETFKTLVLATLAGKRETALIAPTVQSVYDASVKPLAESVLSSIAGGAGVVAPHLRDGNKPNIESAYDFADKQSGRFVPKGGQ